MGWGRKNRGGLTTTVLSMEYNPTSRGSCYTCKEQFKKGELTHVSRFTPDNGKPTVVTKRHPSCASTRLTPKRFTVEQFVDFDKLDAAHKEVARKFVRGEIYNKPGHVGRYISSAEIERQRAEKDKAVRKKERAQKKLKAEAAPAVPAPVDVPTVADASKKKKKAIESDLYDVVTREVDYDNFDDSDDEDDDGEQPDASSSSSSSSKVQKKAKKAVVVSVGKKSRKL